MGLLADSGANKEAKSVVRLTPAAPPVSEATDALLVSPSHTIQQTEPLSLACGFVGSGMARYPARHADVPPCSLAIHQPFGQLATDTPAPCVRC